MNLDLPTDNGSYPRADEQEIERDGATGEDKLDSRGDAKSLSQNMLSFDEFDERQRIAARRRAILTGVGLAVAAVVAPIVTLLLTGRFSTANLHRLAPAPALVSKPLRPTPIPLSPSERKLLDARVGADLHKYVWDELPPVAREEQIAEKAFASVTDANYKDDKTSRDTIREVVVPHFERSIALATAIKPQTDQIHAVHHLMLTSSRLRLMAYEQIAASETDLDTLWRPGVLAEFTESLRRARLYHEAIEELARETHTKLP